MSHVTALPGRLIIGATAALVIVLSAPPPCSAQGQPAVVEGTTQLFIRRGPGREFPPFATLTGGSQVQLQERHGTWARVTTASGQVGYVHSKYLRVLKGDTPAAPTEPSPVPGTAVPPTAVSSTAVPPTVVRPTEVPPTRVATSTRRVQAPPTSTRRRAATPVATHSESSPTASAEDTSTPPPTRTRASLGARSDGANVQHEIERLGEAVEALNRRLDQRFPLPDAGSAPAPASEAGVSGGAILLGLAGLIVGWFLGSTYQRNKERGRRSRIRL